MKGKEEKKSRGTIDYRLSVDVDESFDLEELSKNNVAFLSSHSRTYFPEDPGRSRFAVSHGIHLGSPEDPGPLKYSPKDPRATRPVSLKGYGIGGLSGPRFAKNLHEETPPPWHYQQNAIPPLVRIEPVKDEYASFIRESIRESRLYGSVRGSFLGRTGTQGQEYRVPESQLVTYKPTFQECSHKVISFGSSKKNSRFGGEKNVHTAGVGHYELEKPPIGEIKTIGSFGMGPNFMIPSVYDRCLPTGSDTCFECGKEISTADYYRTPKRILNPLAEPIVKETATKATSPTFPASLTSPIPTAAGDMESTGKSLRTSETGEKETARQTGGDLRRKSRRKSPASNCVPGQRSHIFVNLCRKCYCNGMRGGNRNWSEEFLKENFRKTRNCNYIHDHQNLKEFVNKTSCKSIKKLRRREILLSKYYSDACDKVYKER